MKTLHSTSALLLSLFTSMWVWSCDRSKPAADSSAPQAAGNDPPLKVTLAIPTYALGKNHSIRTVTYVNASSHFSVVISNTSAEPQRVWQEWCSWGYYGLTFELTNSAGQKHIAKKKPTAFGPNYPAQWLLAPQESFVIDVYFGDSETWEGFEKASKGRVTVQGIFEFQPDKNSKEPAVWTGRITSEPVAVTFYDRERKEE